MWFFFRRWRERQQQATAQTPTPILTPPTRPRPVAFEQISRGFYDLTAFEKHDAALKFWLPEPADQALTEFCTMANQSLSEWLRQFLVVYAYGLLALTVLNERCPGFFREGRGLLYSRASPQDPPGKKRVATYWVPELGKNIAPVKVWIPARMKADLQLLADHAEIPLSQFAREIVISRLLGHGMLPSRPVLTRVDPTPAAEAWCLDQDIPWREVSADEYAHHHQGEVRWRFDDLPEAEDAA
ncbi:MAG: hypothetical protein QG599_461 [Pseudomonadota bacterium]|nr:hypothetical protein [Pseudomonadota bacterium]